MARNSNGGCCGNGCCGECCQTYASMCRAFIFMFVIAGWVLSIMTLTECTFILRGDVNIGLFRFENNQTNECVAYRDDNRFGAFQVAARACGVCAAALGGALIVFMVMEWFFNICCSKCMQLWMFTCAQGCQACTFLLYFSNACFSTHGGTFEPLDLCTIGQASVFSWSAFIMYLIGGFTLCCSPKPKPLFCNKRDEEVYFEEPKMKPMVAEPQKAETEALEKVVDEQAEGTAKSSADVEYGMNPTYVEMPAEQVQPMDPDGEKRAWVSSVKYD
mmetsp:Transcript_4252/g.8352  ORF Transcript_4252/g.8352 Transcript_4252/m.8352 type:complete len:274 (-) Transcript_4252:204-1025(-)